MSNSSHAPAAAPLPHVSLALLCAAAVLFLVLPGRLFLSAASLLAQLLVFALIGLCLRLAGVRLERRHGLMLAAAFAAGVCFVFFTVRGREMLYYWDFSNYTVRQLALEDAFAAGVWPGVRFWADTFTEDYTSFLCLFTEFPFCLTDRTPDSYLLSQLWSVYLPLLLVLGGLIEKVIRLMRVRRKMLAFGLSLACAVTLPPVRAAFLLGQPDWFGLIFCLLLVLVTMDYYFESIDLLRWLVIFVCTAALFLTRRWYLYFFVAYDVVYALAVLRCALNLWLDGEWDKAGRTVGRLLIFGSCSLACMLFLFWPVVRHILEYDYGERYAAYSMGGFWMELLLQSQKLGVPQVILLLFALPLLHASALRMPLKITGLSWLVSMVLFTRVQGMGMHHTLLLTPCYLLWIICAVCRLTKRTGKKLRRAWIGCGATVLYGAACVFTPMAVASYPRAVYRWEIRHDGPEAYFSTLSEMSVHRTDAKQVRRLAEWIDAHCAEGEKAYLVPHDMLYNPDLLSNVTLPERPLKEKLCFGFDVRGVHPFPVEFFEAKYVLTADPFPLNYSQSGLSARWNELFLSEASERFRKAARFNMGNGTIFTVYERTQAVDADELRMFCEAFAEEDAAFPDLYHEVWQPYAAQKGFEI